MVLTVNFQHLCDEPYSLYLRNDDFFSGNLFNFFQTQQNVYLFTYKLKIFNFLSIFFSRFHYYSIYNS